MASSKRYGCVSPRLCRYSFSFPPLRLFGEEACKKPPIFPKPVPNWRRREKGVRSCRCTRAPGMFRIVDDKGSWELSWMIDITRGRVGEHPRRVLYLSLLVSLRKEVGPLNCSPDAFEAGKFFRKIDPAVKFEATLSSTRFTGVSTNGNFSGKRENEAGRERER